jgi:hypothetical protein
MAEREEKIGRENRLIKEKVVGWGEKKEKRIENDGGNKKQKGPGKRVRH